MWRNQSSYYIDGWNVNIATLEKSLKMLNVKVVYDLVIPVLNIEGSWMTISFDIVYINR